jgi:hypothetical protein
MEDQQDPTVDEQFAARIVDQYHDFQDAHDRRRARELLDSVLETFPEIVVPLASRLASSERTEDRVQASFLGSLVVAADREVGSAMMARLVEDNSELVADHAVDAIELALDVHELLPSDANPLLRRARRRRKPSA